MGYSILVTGQGGSVSGLSIVYVNTTVISVPLRPIDGGVFSISSCPLREVTVAAKNSTVGRTAVVSHLNRHATLVDHVNGSTTKRFVLSRYHGRGVSVRDLGRSIDVSASVGIKLIARSNRQAFIAGHGNDL